jgi:hypothetical protein
MAEAASLKLTNGRPPRGKLLELCQSLYHSAIRSRARLVGLAPQKLYSSPCINLTAADISHTWVR